MPELFKTPCKQGDLIITDSAIIVERPSAFDKRKKLTSETMLRASFVDLDYKKPAFLATINLTFIGQGGKQLHADWVKREDADRVQALLTGRD